jgi:hypothetical protein
MVWTVHRADFRNRTYSGADRIMAGQNHEGMEHELSVAS